MFRLLGNMFGGVLKEADDLGGGTGGADPAGGGADPLGGGADPAGDVGKKEGGSSGNGVNDFLLGGGSDPAGGDGGKKEDGDGDGDKKGGAASSDGGGKDEPVAYDKYVLDGGYGEGVVEGSPEFSYMEKLREMAHKQGVSLEAFGALAKGMLAYDQEVGKAMESARIAEAEKCVEGLKAEYGAKFAEAQVYAREALDKLAKSAGVSREEMAIFSVPEVATNPALFKMLSSLGAQMREGGFVKGTASAGGSSRDNYYAVLNDTSHPDHRAYMYSDDPRHKEVNAKMDAWHADFNR